MARTRKYRLRADVMVDRRNYQMMTQDELAKMIGMSKSQISRIENEEHIPYYSTIKKVASALDLPANDLVEWFTTEENRGRIQETKEDNADRRKQLLHEVDGDEPTDDSGDRAS